MTNDQATSAHDPRPGEAVVQVLATLGPNDKWSTLTLDLLGDASALARRWSGRVGAWVLTAPSTPVLAFDELAAHGCNLVRRSRLWARGGPAPDQLGWRAGLARLAGYLLTHRKIRNDPYAGWMHLMIFWGFLALLLATTLVGIQHHLGLEFLTGNTYLDTAARTAYLSRGPSYKVSWREFVFGAKE